LRSITTSFVKILITATGISKLLVDHGDRQATGVIGLDRVRQLKQPFLGGLGDSRTVALA
jgi:hypothetical protein